jgi:hypothetical protein
MGADAAAQSKLGWTAEAVPCPTASSTAASAPKPPRHAMN